MNAKIECERYTHPSISRRDVEIVQVHNVIFPNHPLQTLQQCNGVFADPWWILISQNVDDDDAIVGIATLGEYPSETKFFLYNVGIVPSFRHHGLAQKLRIFLAERFPDCEIVGAVSIQNAEMVAILERFGARKQDTVQEKDQTYVRYSWKP